MQPILIVGAGIAGLALAQGLKLRGIPFKIYERDADATSRRQGYRIRLTLLGLNSLKEILPPDIYSEVKRPAPRSEPTDIHAVLANTGEPVPAAPPGTTQIPPKILDVNDDFIRQAMSSRLPVDRNVLRKVLLSGIGVHVVWGKHVVRYETSERGVRLHFEDDSISDEGALLVGTDGLHSRIALQFAGDVVSPTELGPRQIYGLSPVTPNLNNVLGEELGKGIHFILDPSHTRDPIAPTTRTMVFEACRFTHEGAPADYVFWFLADTAGFREVLPSTSTGLTNANVASVAEAATTQFFAPFHAIIKGQDPSLTATWPMATAKHDGLPALPLNRRVTILGDAVHPMPPNGGQSGNAALRSVATLLRTLTDTASEDGWSEEVIGEFQDKMLHDASQLVALAHAAAINSYPLSAWRPHMLSDPVP